MAEKTYREVTVKDRENTAITNNIQLTPVHFLKPRGRAGKQSTLWTVIESNKDSELERNVRI